MPPGASSTTAPDDAIDAILAAQGAAVVRGDEPAWLAQADPGNTSLVNQLHAVFTALRALRVTALDADARRQSPWAFDAAGTTRVHFGYCSQTETCPALSSPPDGPPNREGFVADVSWRLSGVRWQMTAFDTLSPAGRPILTASPLPWIVTPLRAAVGDRVTVFAPAAMKTDLDDVLTVATAAAVNADRFARWVHPTRYVVYLAARDTWNVWLDPPSLATAAAYADPTSLSSDVVVVDYPAARQRLNYVLRHEFGHVATLIGSRQTGPAYLLEGVAEYVAQSGRPVTDYPLLPVVRAFVRAGRWDDDFDSLRPYSQDDAVSAAGYGLGFLLWRCIHDTYGDNAMFGFAEYALRSDGALDDPARVLLGSSWTSVKGRCAHYVRSILD